MSRSPGALDTRARRRVRGTAGVGEASYSTLSLAAVVAASLVSGWLVFAHLLLPAPSAGWDEAAHALRGLLIAHDVRELDVPAFLHDSYRQVYWPPIHAWLVGAAILIAGPSIEAARFVSVLAFVLLALTLFFVARTLQPRYADLAGGVAAALALTSPGIIAFAARAMLELPGLLALSCTLLVYCRLAHAESASPRAHMLVGVLVMVTYLVKLNYGILLMISIGLARLIDAHFRPRRLLTWQNFYTALPVIVLSAIWFAYPQKLIVTWDTLVNEPTGRAEAQGVAGPLYYPLAILRLSGSPWMGILLLASLAFAWKRRRESGVMLLLVVAITQLLIGELHHTKGIRHILPMFPALFVFSGVAAAELWAWLSARGRIARYAAGGLVALLALLQARILVRTEWHPAVNAQLAEVLRYVSSVTHQHAPALVLSTVHARPGPPIVDWHLAAGERLLAVTAAGSVMDPEPHRRLAEAVSRAPLPHGLRERARLVFSRYDNATGTRSLHIAAALDDKQPPFESELARTLSDSSVRAVIAITSASDSDTDRYSIAFIDPSLRRAGFVGSSVEEFTAVGARVHVYERR
jgi:4-amino-4-deoxy-L-arabinose transferase-like glycosyltransferase